MEFGAIRNHCAPVASGVAVREVRDIVSLSSTSAEVEVAASRNAIDAAKPDKEERSGGMRVKTESLFYQFRSRPNNGCLSNSMCFCIHPLKNSSPKRRRLAPLPAGLSDPLAGGQTIGRNKRRLVAEAAAALSDA